MQFIDLKAQYKTIEEKINKQIKTVLDHGMYILGPEVTTLEKNLSEWVKVKHSVTCANGTDAIVIALRALGIGPGDEVITTAFSFFATAEMIHMSGATPVFVDINPETLNIDEDKIEAKITKKTKAIMPVSLYGQMPDMDKIMNIAKKHNLYVVEDAAQSFGAEMNGKKSCSIAHVSTTSFFPAKPLGCYGDGGAMFTNDDEVAEKMKTLRNHGQATRYNHVVMGYNSRLDTIQAAILIEKLAIFSDEIKLRNKFAKVYDDAFKGKIKTAKVMNGHTSVWAQYTILVNNRNEFCANLQKEGIPTAVHYPIPMHLQEAFRFLGVGPGTCPISESLCHQVVSLPIHPYMNSTDQNKVIENVLKFAK
jgi:UDP-2-acetamido-2-deoxy-ribo-hexuluronate aminotransferase